ncbi:MAG: hypothetical protein A3J70_02180 [Elusimicrobia bacterium RIFCSPHIGHO2_02_FULL_61_10]|nr:MAG: hypothetical protein A3J70_02180 [Elusimicrobia bacterium RIFCSPHIGHO2_02_FULL_61_10]
MIEKEKILKILGWAAFAVSASAFFLPVVNPDVFWHLSAGKYAAEHLAPPRFDFLSWPSAGEKWVDFEWGAQLLYYLAWKAGGFKALLVFKGLLLCLVLAVFRGLALLYRRASLLPLVLPLLAAALAGASDLRPENFSLLFFSLTLYGLEKIRLKELVSGRKSLFFTFLLFAVWINLDPGCFYGLALTGLYAAGEFFSGRPRRGLEYLKLLLAGLAATLVNPYGPELYAVIAAHGLRSPVPGEHLGVWAASTFGNPHFWPYLALLAGISSGLLLFFLRRRYAVYPHFAGLIFFIWASAGYSGNIPFFIISGLAFAMALPWELPRFSSRGPLVLGGAACGACLVLWFYASFIWPHYTGKTPVFRASSDNLARFLKASKKELSGLRLYNYGDWGGWLGWELAPDYKVFMDGRYLFKDKAGELAVDGRGYRRWSGLLEKYKFDLMLITLNEPLVPIKQRLANGRVELFWRPAYLFYLPKKDWAVVYWDYRVAALVRRSAVPAAWVAAREYRYLRPTDVPNLASPVLAGEIPLSGLDRELALFLGSHPGGAEAPANTSLVNFCRLIKEACAKKGARCLL